MSRLKLQKLGAQCKPNANITLMQMVAVLKSRMCLWICITFSHILHPNCLHTVGSLNISNLKYYSPFIMDQVEIKQLNGSFKS